MAELVRTNDLGIISVIEGLLGEISEAQVIQYPWT